MQNIDEQLLLIDKQIQKIKQSNNSSNVPYLVNSFTDKFDEVLTDIILDYGYDFDKIALHLYYLFPQYQQRLNNKVVSFRWWQIQIQKKLYQSNKLMGQQNDQKRKQKYCNSKDKQQQNNDNNEYNRVQLFPDGLYPFLHSNNNSYNNYNQNVNKYQYNNKMRGQMLLQSYCRALQRSQILTQQQQQRFILYKPKFIIDSEYQLQRYQVQDNNNNGRWNQQDNNVDNREVNQNNNLDNNLDNKNKNNMNDLIIQKLLKKVVSNQFQYDQFGGFNNYVQFNHYHLIQSNYIHNQQNYNHNINLRNNNQNNNNLKNNQNYNNELINNKQNNKRKWWEQNNQSSQSQSQYQSQSSQSQQQQNKKYKDNYITKQNKKVDQLQYLDQQQYLYKQKQINKQQQYFEQNKQQNNQYGIEQDWDDYQSD